ncbi:uncharacterized protein BDZ99DRAFT_453896, partial [Mytilinidion resinicola]
MIQSYRAHATATYSGNAEAMSTMVLTIMELWVECDKYTTKHYPLLLGYTTGFTSGVFDSLVLTKREQLLRLHSVESYLESRALRAVDGYPWLLSGKSLAAKYYTYSHFLQHLHEKILYEADQAKKEKKATIHQNKEKYNDYRFRFVSTDIHNNATIDIHTANPENILTTHSRQYDLYKCTSSVASSSNTVPEPRSDHAYPPLTLREPLRSWIVGSAHFSNEVIAKVSERPLNMSSEEFKAFGNLRAGHHLQWYNILQQLLVPTLDFNKPETFFLILQAANEAGPKSDAEPLRETHFVLEDVEFGQTLLIGLWDALRRVWDNWENDIACSILASIATRILSLACDRNVHKQCLMYLKEIRDRSIEWCRTLRAKLKETCARNERANMGRRILIIALLCHGTFEVGASHLPSILSCNSEASIMIESSMIIAEHLAHGGDAQACNFNCFLKILIYRWRHASYKAEPLLRDSITNNPANCLDIVINKTFPAHEGASISWTCRPGQHQHVLVANTEASERRLSLHLQYNVLTSVFLVNGQTPSGLPPEYIAHSTYQRLFGDQLFQAAPSSQSRMSFQCTHSEAGYEIHLGLVSGELIVRMRDTKISGNRYHELIPPSKLQGHIPNLLVSEYTHWYVVGESLIEFRLPRDIWSPFDKDRGIAFHIDEQGSVYLIKGSSKAMVGLESQTARALSAIFRPIERPEYIHLTYDRPNSTLEIDLPRYGTSFSLHKKESTIHSKSYRGMAIDPDQSLGALHGLSSKLVLFSTDDHQNGLVSRATMIPEGELYTSREHEGYGSAWLSSSEPGGHNSISYHYYHIDEGLGLLRGSGTLRSELWLCYVYAFTSHFLPDPLTECTGTESALRILNSKLVQSLILSEPLKKEDELKLLGRISKISPSRSLSYFSSGRIQSARWSDFSPLAQTDAFYQDVQLSLKKVHDFEIIFHGRRENQNSVTDPSDRLHSWHRTRLSPYERPGYEARSPSTITEYVYSSRQSSKTLEAERNTCILAKLLNPLAGSDCDVYELTMFFAALVFAKNEDDQIIQALLLFAMSLPPTSGNKRLKPQKESKHRLSEPHTAKPDVLNLIDRTVFDERQIEALAEKYAPDISPWDWYEYERRRQERSRDVQALVRATRAHWDTGSTKDPIYKIDSRGFLLATFTNEIRVLLRSWRRNEKHMQHLRTVIEEAAPFEILGADDVRDDPKREIFWEPPSNSCNEMSLQYLFKRLPAPDIKAPPPRAFPEYLRLASLDMSAVVIEPEMSELLKVLKSLPETGEQRKQYITDLGKSRDALGTTTEIRSSIAASEVCNQLLKALQALEIYLQECRQSHTIAEHMRVRQGGNSVLQLNMGEGKSSVIVPVVAASLAEAPRLVRVIVTKAQFQQMRHRLSTSLGRFQHRQVYTLPFSRRIGLDESRSRLVKAMCQECGTNGGILLMQLDHVLSLKLLGLDKIISGSQATGNILTNTEFAFERYVRDIVDESDDIFNAKLELTYTMGQQVALGFSPQRWRLTQAALEAVFETLPDVKREFPDGLLMEPSSYVGGMPRVRILRTTATRRLLEETTRRLLQKGQEGLSVLSLDPDHQEAIMRYIIELFPSPGDIEITEKLFATATERQPLLVLRGLMANGVLEFTLHRKRWRVHYGRDYERENGIPGLAVPYWAKDSPVPNAEFSHPEVYIILTCLSYYYQGLSDDELFDLFDHLRAADNGEVEYEQWTVLDGNLPKVLSGVNTKNQTHCKEQVFSRLRNFKPVIDSYLSNVLFPRKTAEYQMKLSASGWDLVGERMHPIIGFSGTNDSKVLLPYSIHQHDLKEQKHTNAAVLNLLLRGDNGIQTLGHDSASEESNSYTQRLLKKVIESKSPVQVIIDVGAQFIEHGNLDVARLWLAMDPTATAKAVITFDERDELVVVTRDTPVELLASSPYFSNMHSCYVFLDEMHTRGTDLVLPEDYRAAVMLGPEVTKDKLVQACMRMRKLGKGQTLSFYVPEEVELTIRRICNISPENPIRKVDMIRWAIWETWRECEKLIPLWASQGIRHWKQQTIWKMAKTQKNRRIDMRLEWAERYLEPEAQTLEQCYRPRSENPGSIWPDETSGIPENGDQKLKFIRQTCEKFRVVGLEAELLIEEYDRQVVREVQQERQVAREVQQISEFQKPPTLTPHQPTADLEVANFLRTGKIKEDSEAFLPAFEAFRHSSAAQLIDLSEFPNTLLATRDFIETVEREASDHVADQHFRPVQWVVSRAIDGKSGDDYVNQLILISSWEANNFLGLLRETNKVVFHLYAPRTNLSHRSLSDLTLFTIPALPQGWTVPRSLVLFLNLFAGQLFLDSHAEYIQLYDFL